MSELPTAALPPDSQMGSDGRPHHECGFSFIATVEKCPAARRPKHTASSLVSSAERGTALHAILEKVVQKWAEVVEYGPELIGAQSTDLADLVVLFTKGLPPSDIEALQRVIAEIKPFFCAEPGMLFGTEERIDLRSSDGEVMSFGYYDIFLKLGKTAMIVDHKFVRKEVEAAEENRQGHALAVAVWQTYKDVEDVVVLFTMPECGSTMYRFSRTVDEARLTRELEEIFKRREQPFKTLQTGDHCVYCDFRNTCEASLRGLKTMVTGISPLAVPESFAPNLIRSAEDMALLRYWADTVQPVIDAIKEESMKWAQEKQGVSTIVNGQRIEYKVQSRSLPRKLASPIEIWNVIQEWMPAEAFISACKVGVNDLETVVVELLSSRLIDEGKTPNADAIASTFSNMLQEKGLLTKEEGRTFFLKRVKASAKKLKNVIASVSEPETETPVEV